MADSVPGAKDDNRPRTEKAAPRRKKDAGGILGRLRGQKPRDAGDRPKGWDVTDLVAAMQMLGLEPSGLARFISSLHRLAVASGVDPTVLASLIKDLDRLSEGKHLTIEQVRVKIRELAEEHEKLARKVAELEAKKLSLESGIEKAEGEGRQELARYHELDQKLAGAGVSLDELGKLSSMVAHARQLGFESSRLTGLLADLGSVEQRKAELEGSVDRLIETKRAAEGRVLSLEQELEKKRAILESADSLHRTGFDPKDLDDLAAAVRMISKTRNIDEASARQRLLSDLQSYYSNDYELRGRIGALEALLREKEEKLGMLEADFRNERAVLEAASKLMSAGLDKEWLAKLRTVIDSYGTDMDALARDLETKKSLGASIEGLARTKRALEEEERLLRQKVVAAEDQRIKTLSMINDIIVNKASPSSIQTAKSAGENQPLEMTDSRVLLASAQRAIEAVSSKLAADSRARLVLEHALLALRLEASRE